MQHKKSGHAQPEMCKKFHVVYFTKRSFPPIVTSENIEAKNMIEALQLFTGHHPNLLNDILYITEKA